MASRLPVIDDDGEVGDLSEVDPSLFKSLNSLPADLQAKLLSLKKPPLKARITIRLSPEVVTTFRATGSGWQTRIDAALKDWLKTHTPT